jgi:carboxymethylenebutenolidase
LSDKDITLNAADGGSFGAYLAGPGNVPAAPAVVVLQEIFGLSPFIRDVCDRLAQAGFLAIAPDLFWRQERGVQLNSDDPAARERGMKLLRGLDEARAVEDAAAALAYVRSLKQCTGKVAALGYCLGGKLAYLMAASTSIDAAVSYYGTGIHAALAEASKISTPLLLHIAAEDALCPPPAQQEIARALGGISRVTLRTHQGVGHAFARRGSAAYIAAAAEAADAETLSFLARNLR